jgi:hypothetical protein
MTPLSVIQNEEMLKGNFALMFSVHKRNSYIPDRNITIEEAAKCVILQSKWASSHELVSLPTTQKLDIKIKSITECNINGLGVLITIEIDEKGEPPYHNQFLVTESESHWYLFDYSVASVTRPREIGQGKTATIAKY